MHTTEPIMRDGAGFDDLLEDDFDGDDYAEADERGNGEKRDIPSAPPRLRRDIPSAPPRSSDLNGRRDGRRVLELRGVTGAGDHRQGRVR